METALIAVVGTLLGVVATHWFQGRGGERRAALARQALVRQALVRVRLDEFIAAAAPGVR